MDLENVLPLRGHVLKYLDGKGHDVGNLGSDGSANLFMWVEREFVRTKMENVETLLTLKKDTWFSMYSFNFLVTGNVSKLEFGGKTYTV